MSYQTATAETLFQTGQPLKQILIDVRTPAEFQQSHMPESISMPLDAVDVTQVRTLVAQREAEGVLLICQSGQRAQNAAKKLAGQIDMPVTVIEGGLNAIAKLNINLVRGTGKNIISIERQTRIAAGTLMLVGIIGSLWLHPGFLWLSGVVGAGLVFAGVTNTCGMGLLLARMPWNR